MKMRYTHARPGFSLISRSDVTGFHLPRTCVGVDLPPRVDMGSRHPMPLMPFDVVVGLEKFSSNFCAPTSAVMSSPRPMLPPAPLTQVPREEKDRGSGYDLLGGSSLNDESFMDHGLVGNERSL